MPADKIPEMADNALMNVNGIRLNPRQPSRKTSSPSSGRRFRGEAMPIINVAMLEGRTLEQSAS